MKIFEFNRLYLFLIFIFLLIFYILYCIADTKELLDIPADVHANNVNTATANTSTTIPLLKTPGAGADGQLAGIGECRNTCGSNKDCNIVFGRGLNTCVNGKCSCVSGTGTFCHLKPNYYKNPREMTPAQIIKFKNDADLSKMTLEDYKNWLGLFEFDLNNLPKIHLNNYNRLKEGLPIYDIPLSDPVDEFFASSAARRDRVCLDIPNSDVDSPLNWKLHPSLNNMGKINSRGQTDVSLGYAQYAPNNKLDEGNVFSTERTYERTNEVTVKDLLWNNINWLFYDIDRNAMWRYNDPNQNRFLNIITNKVEVPKQPTLESKSLMADDFATGKKSIPQPSGVGV